MSELSQRASDRRERDAYRKEVERLSAIEERAKEVLREREDSTAAYILEGGTRHVGKPDARKGLISATPSPTIAALEPPQLTESDAALVARLRYSAESGSAWAAGQDRTMLEAADRIEAKVKRCKHERVTIRTIVVRYGKRAECLDCGASWPSWKRAAPKWAKNAFATANRGKTND